MEIFKLFWRPEGSAPRTPYEADPLKCCPPPNRNSGGAAALLMKVAPKTNKLISGSALSTITFKKSMLKLGFGEFVISNSTSYTKRKNFTRFTKSPMKFLTWKLILSSRKCINVTRHIATFTKSWAFLNIDKINSRQM